MATLDLSSKTVIELRKMAKEHGVVLGAGLNKEGIIQKLTAALEPSEEPSAPQSVPQSAPAPVQESAPQSAQPQYRAAWHNPAPRYNSKPAYQAPGYQQRQGGGWQASRQPTADAPRPAQTRPTGFTPRFGPSAQAEAPASQPRQEEQPRPYRSEAPRYNAPAYGEQQRTERPYEASQRSYENPPPQRSYESQPAYDRPRYEQRPYQPRRENDYQPRQEAMPTPEAIAELLSAGDCLEASGVLELHPDGYGFLRSEALLPSSRDIYVSMAQIRRFGLRTGDLVAGKTRPQKDSDKYAALLYVSHINGVPADDHASRPLYEELTPVYPSRRINLEAKGNTMRLVDLITPLGFGQRALLLCPPETGKTELLRDFANVIAANHPNAKVMVLLIDETPEDVTLFREQVSCQVAASTFDQPPENHLRLADLAIERAQRLVEQGQDVVIIVDSLTRLAKTYTTTAAQQGRGMPGMVNPSSLFKAKKLFGAARCMKEGGSLTIIAAMNVETGNKVDDTIVEEFKGTANMELWLDASVARAGVSPALNLSLCQTKRAELLLTPQQLEGLKLVRSIMTSTRSVAAIPQLESMMDKASSNDELLKRIKSWVEVMKQGR